MWEEIGASELDWGPFPRRKGNWFLVTAGDEAACNPLLGTFGGFLSLWGRDCAAVFLREHRYTRALLERSARFSIAVLPEAYRDAVRYCGAHSGRDGDKWAVAGLTPVFVDGTPLPAKASLAILCRKLCAAPLESGWLAPDIRAVYFEGRKAGNPYFFYAGEITKILRRK